MQRDSSSQTSAQARLSSHAKTDRGISLRQEVHLCKSDLRAQDAQDVLAEHSGPTATESELADPADT